MDQITIEDSNLQKLLDENSECQRNKRLYEESLTNYNSLLASFNELKGELERENNRNIT